MEHLHPGLSHVSQMPAGTLSVSAGRHTHTHAHTHISMKCVYMQIALYKEIVILELVFVCWGLM